MKAIFASMRAKGLWNFIRRFFILLNRFGFSAKRMETYLNEYNRILNEYNCKANFFMPAQLLYKYRKIIKQHINSISLHGYKHIDYSAISLPRHETHIDKAIGIAKQIGINTDCFRFPYLRYGRESIKSLSQKGFRHDSTQPILWPVIPKSQRILDFYKPLDPDQYSSLPYLKDGLLEIPVSLPDDEILIDRLRICDVDKLFFIWKSILDITYARGEIFVLQLHPERILICGEALKKLIQEARKKNPPVWIATLEELSQYWLKPKSGGLKDWPENYRSVFCITGDIDAFTLWDFFSRLL